MMTDCFLLIRHKRAIARRLYGEIRNLPIISPHGHTDPQWFADNLPFPDPAALLITPDHYVYRMLYSQGISLESLGIPSVDGGPVERDSHKIWRLLLNAGIYFAAHQVICGFPMSCTMFSASAKTVGGISGSHLRCHCGLPVAPGISASRAF